MTEPGPSGTGSDDGPDRSHQLAVVALCVIGLLVAAAAVPTPSDAGGAAGGGDGDGAGDAGVDDLLRLFVGDGDSGNDVVADGPSNSQTCTVTLAEKPVPGTLTDAIVTSGDAPVGGAAVRFNGRYVGDTDDSGRVTGRVPYERQFVVSATLPADARCQTTTTAEDRRATEAALSGADGRTGATLGTVGRAPVAINEGRRASAASNLTKTYRVDGSVSIAVAGDRLPGERVTVAARIEDEPMANASVAVDGRRVGRTDDDGTYELQLPDDGRTTLRLRVARGEFSATRTVPLTTFSATIRPAGRLAVPTTEATLIAQLGGEPVADAVVTMDGRRVGTTDESGHVQFRLPRDPTASLTVRAAGQTVTKSVWPLYAGTALFTGVAILLVGLGLVVIVRGLAWLGGIAAWYAAVLLRVASRLDVTLGRLHRWLQRHWERLVAAARSLHERIVARSVSLAHLSGWLRSVPGRLRGWLVRAISRLRRVPGTVWQWLRGGPQSDGQSAAPVDSDGRPAAGQSEPRGMRERWRAFARWVAPERWRNRTPGEVARAAVEAGYPRESVVTLTRVFRDVEYGEAPLSAERRERARTAFESLSSSRTERHDGTQEGDD